MERCLRLLEKQNQYCQNDHTPQTAMQTSRSPSQNINSTFHRSRENNHKTRKKQNSRTTLSNKSKAGSLTTPDFKVYHEAIVTKHAVALKQNRGKWISGTAERIWKRPRTNSAI